MYTQLIAALVPASLVAAVGNSNNVCNKNPYLALRPLSKLPAVQSFCTSKFPAVPCTTTLTTTATATSFTTVSTSTTTTGTTTKTTTVQIDTVQSATSTSTSTVFTGTTTTTTFTSTSTSTTFTTTATVCSTTNDKRDTPDVEPARDGLQYHTLIQRPKLAGRYVPVGRREPARATPCPTPDALKKLAASAVKTFCSCVTKAAPCAAAAATATSTTTSSVTATVSTQATSTTSVTAVTTEFIISTTTISTVTTATTSEVSTTVLSTSTVSQVPCLSCTSGTFCDSKQNNSLVSRDSYANERLPLP
ncbi:hypothetical protein CB0940_04880 [Cercospora beticola]|uniref:Uncharacterized protein n=1 Tax=Cercospora beticola TaxID=122368 RepID=A0A2G5HJP3_CERBT|nr:hypothetical protein CB0940_04880 [Cercospora beticola]PIA92735.1 hypothetical protein CB0940_04880 [Cercospora beticola]WPB02163.1 hypothetical protein RHO25_006797 [Cercospora beticola]